MKLVSIGRITKLGVTNFWRNYWLSFVNSIILTMTLLVISVFVIFNIVIDTTTDNIKQKINIAVYFNDEASQEEIDKLSDLLQRRIDVEEVIFISKDQALERWQDIQIEQKIKEQVTSEDNPLPRSIEVKPKNPENLDSIATFLKRPSFQEITRNISYEQNEKIIKQLINITKFVQKLGLILSILFISIAVLVILNTIRLAIFTRKQEIEIMKIVGANNHFIDLPFIIESILIAISATIISTLLIWLGIHYITEVTNRYLSGVSINLETFFQTNLLWIILFELIIGMMITTICTLISIRKYLKI